MCIQFLQAQNSETKQQIECNHKSPTMLSFVGGEHITDAVALNLLGQSAYDRLQVAKGFNRATGAFCGLAIVGVIGGATFGICWGVGQYWAMAPTIAFCGLFFNAFILELIFASVRNGIMRNIVNDYNNNTLTFGRDGEMHLAHKSPVRIGASSNGMGIALHF